ncbi:MAG: DUF5719 family protein [Actinomycetota bacterium]|jgi:hypothetical protein
MTKRGPAIGVIALVLVGAWAVDATVDRPAPTVTERVQTPMGARSGARSSAWFCAGATAEEGGEADGTVVVANAGRQPLTGTVTVMPEEGEPRQVGLSVPASGHQSVRLRDVLTAPYASALVELDGGEAVVELAATGPLGRSVTPCASSASTTWYFAEGVTTRDAREVITLFNPFPEDAVVDLVFNTEEGEVTPQALTGLSVKGRAMTAVTVGDHVQRRLAVAARISARAGRLVAARLQTFDGSEGRRGMSVGLGAAAPGDVWYFPEGFLTDGLTERFQIFNPGSEEAEVAVNLALEQGQAEPIVLTVPPESRVTLAANDEARIPKNVAHAVTVRSTNGVPVVVERTIDAVAPAARSGVSIIIGARAPATRWVVAAAQSDDTTEAWLVVHNPGASATRVTVALLDGSASVPPGLAAIEVGARARRAIKLTGTVRPGPVPVLVTATQPVVVERDLYAIGSLGTAMSPAVPLRD